MRCGFGPSELKKTVVFSLERFLGKKFGKQSLSPLLLLRGVFLFRSLVPGLTTQLLSKDDFRHTGIFYPHFSGYLEPNQ